MNTSNETECDLTKVISLLKQHAYYSQQTSLMCQAITVDLNIASVYDLLNEKIKLKILLDEIKMTYEYMNAKRKYAIKQISNRNDGLITDSIIT